MQTDYPTHLERPHPLADHDHGTEPQAPVSISHFLRVLRSYRALIILSLIGVAVGYLIVAIALYTFSPSQRTTFQTFRVDFEGAVNGEYPNKTKFNIADVISGPILGRVYRDNRLADYLPFGEFSRAIFVLESNREYEQLAAEYQAQLADTKLTAVDRERLQREFELKRQSIAKNEYAIHLSRKVGVKRIPDPIARKILLNVLDDWADFEVNQQHVIAYEVSVLSPEVLNPSAIEQNDVVAAIEVLRSKAKRAIRNVEKIEKLPGATVARTPADNLSLEEVRVGLDEIIRFRLEPLLAVSLHTPGFTRDRASTIRFLESQLLYDQRQLAAAQHLADSVREAIAVYEQPERSAVPSTSKTTIEPAKSGEAVMPQLSDTFLDRLMTMTGRAADAQYRQRLIADYRLSFAATIPWQEAVAYDTAVLEDLRKPGGGSTASPETVRSQIEEMRHEIANLVTKMNELFQIVSRNMTPSTQLFTLTAPPAARTLRAVDASRLALYGALIELIALPVIIIGCLVHNRVREEETAEEFVRDEQGAAT